MSKCVYAGSFDPITLGHIDIIERAARLFGGLTIVLAINNDKKYAFSLEQRINFIKKSTAHINGISVDSTNGLLIDYMREIKADIIVRGLRTGADFEHEYQMASSNAKLSNDIETVFMMADPKFSFISSSLVRELVLHGAGLEGFVPEIIIGDIKKYIGR